MRMRQYICHKDHNLWDVIVNGDLEEEPAPTRDQSGPSAPPAPKTAKQLAARRNQERVKSILLLAIPDEYLLKFHNVADAKSLWEAIKSRFGGNIESMKMQKNVLKHLFENFSTASNESLDKASDRFQKLISQLEVHGAPISKEDINQKFLRSLPSLWNQIALIMRNKPDIDEIDIDDLYNNFRVYENELKRSSGSNFTFQNLAFLSSENTGGTNEVSTTSRDFRVSTTGGINQVPSTPWHFARECRSGRNQGRRSYGDNGKSNAPTNESSSQALVAQDGLGGYDWSNDFELEPVNYALMAISSSNSLSSSDNTVQKCSKQCLDSFKTLQKNYDTDREKHNKAILEIRGYEIALESLESRILGHEKNELAWEKVVKERDELKDKIAKWEVSSKNLDEILNSQMSARDQTGKINDANTKKPKSVSESVVSNPKINRDSVIIEDWNSDDEEEGYEMQTVRPETQTVKTRDDKSGQTSKKQGIGFKKVKACFVCKTTDHLIKDNNFHYKKSQEPKLKNMVNTGQREGKPVWDNTKRVNYQNFSKYPHLSKTFVPSGVLTRTGFVSTARPSISTARLSICTARPSISTARPSISIVRPVCTARPSISIARPIYASRPIYLRMDNVRPRGSCLPIKRSYYTKPAFRPKDLKQDVKTFGVKNMTTAGKRVVVNTGKGKLDTDLKKSRWVWRPKGNYLDRVSKDSGSFMLKKIEYGNPEILLQDHAVVDSGCSSYMTGNKAYLSDYEDFNGGFVSFGSDPKGGKITGKGKIKTANLDFDDVYFLDELKTIDEGYLAWILNTSKALEYTTKDQKGRKRILHFNFLEDSTKMMAGTGLNWMFDLDFLTNSMNYIPVSIENHVNVDAEKPSENASPNKDIQDSEDVIDKEGQHQMPEDEQVLQDELEMMVTQELVAKAMDDVSRQAFEEEKRKIASQKKAAQATSTNTLSTDRPSVSTDRPFVSTDRSNTPYVSAASTPTGANAGESSFVYLGGKIPIDASTLPNANLPIDPNMLDLEDASDTLPNDGIFNGAYDDDEDVGAVADFNNMDNTIVVSPIPTLRIHKDHPKGQILGDPTSAVQTRGKIQKASSAQQALQYSGIASVQPDRKVWGTCLIFHMGKKEEVPLTKHCLSEEEKDLSDISQDKYVADILKKFDFLSIRTATTPIESNKPLVKDKDGVDVDVHVHVYRSMIGSLMYLSASRPDIMFAVCACTRFQVTLKASHLNAVKRIFRYLKHQTKLGLWYPRDSPFELKAYSDSDYGGASLDKKSTTSRCQFLGRRLISWQCKKQTIMVNSTIEAEYVAAANCCGQVLWIQN
ncbi:hypothetical protein Tco_0508783 [Tanacetum coccineum]